MGAADVVPGVSGGTVALVTGIYENLLAAISFFNAKFIKNILSFRIKEALHGMHIRFLVVLFSGILFALFSLARLMHYLMTEHSVLTWSAFFGLVLASIVVVFRQLDAPFSPKNMICLIVGGIFSYICVSLIPVSTPNDLWFIYLCGVIGISAMILPGLSGSFLLLILGKYAYITGAVKNPFAEGAFIILIVFAAGSATGALGFSKILNYFLNNYRSSTMAALVGILIGSIKKVWPWKEVLKSEVIRGKTKVLQEAVYVPESFNSEVAWGIALAAAGFIGVLLLEHVSSSGEDTESKA
jgi:putative membrane protein